MVSEGYSPPTGQQSVVLVIEILRAGGALAGWARRNSLDAATSALPVELEVVMDGETVQRFNTGQNRPDLGAALGFTTHFSKPLPLIDFWNGRVTFRGLDRDTAQVTCHFTGEARANLLTAAAEQLTTVFGGDVAAEILKIANQSRDLKARTESLAYWEARSDVAALVEDKLRSLGVDWRTTKETSMVPVPVGYVSPDGSAMVGSGGQILLIGGSNAVLDQSLLPIESSVRDVAERWVDLFEQRAIQCEERKLKYFQILIPEKQTVLRSECPAAIPTPTAYAAGLNEAIKMRPYAAEKYLDLLPILQQFAQRQPPFPRTDSHLTPAANYACFTEILRKMGLKSPFRPTFEETETIIGDLSERLFGIPLRETISIQGGESAEARTVPTLKTATTPAGGQHIGIHYSWESPEAPFDSCVVCFGNSFFERGGSRGLSYWFARAFREFHFIWSPELNPDFAKSVGASFVLGQTIERFLAYVPSR
jgi:hypothetical protein